MGWQYHRSGDESSPESLVPVKVRITHFMEQLDEEQEETLYMDRGFDSGDLEKVIKDQYGRRGVDFSFEEIK